jgi:hypothetical protein
MSGQKVLSSTLAKEDRQKLGRPRESAVEGPCRRRLEPGERKQR